MSKMYALEVMKPNTATSRELLDEDSFNSYLQMIKKYEYQKQEQMIGDKLKATTYYAKLGEKTVALTEYEK